MFKAKTLPDIISGDECQYVINSAIDADLWVNSENKSDFWHRRVTNYIHLLRVDILACEILLDANNKTKNFIMNEYNLDKEIYPDNLQVIRWFDGMSQNPHSDTMVGTPDEEYHIHRAFGSVIYLNTDYSGGRTYYPNYGTEVVPESGKLAVHPADTDHLHGVTAISGNVRYTISSFWTFDKEKGFDWSLYK